MSSIGVSCQERDSLGVLRESLDRVLSWVQQWDEVCVTSDWAPDNFGFRSGREDEPITFDWGTAHLGPMEEDLTIVLSRLSGLDEQGRRTLLQDYLDTYGQKSGSRIGTGDFLARIPWAEFLRTVRLFLEHMEALRWIPHQTRSKEFIHLFVRCAPKLLDQARRT